MSKKFVSGANLQEVWQTHIKPKLNTKQDQLPEGTVGQVLTKTEDGVKWAAATLETDMIDAQKFSDNFEEALRAAIAFAKTGKRTLIDARSFTGKHTCNSRFVVDCPVTIMLGNIKATMKDSVFFDIQSDNVVIEGKNRHADNTVLSGENTTELILQGISQNYNEGYHIYSHGVKSCQYRNMTLTGVRSSVRSQEGSTSTPIDGTGGIFIEKEDPGTTGAGNTCNNIIIEGILINGSKAAGIYIDTPILTEIRNVRVSAAGGHGIYLSGGTSVLLESCYVSSANYAGFCLEKLTYATVINSVAETCGCGWWIRSCSNISLLSPGCESTTILPKNPWSTQYNETKRYGKGLTTRSASGEVIKVKDVTDDYWELDDQKIYARGLFLGYGFVITGGKYITLYTPYVTTIAQQTNATAAGSLSADVLQVLNYLMVLGAARNVTIVNFGAKENSGSSLPSKLIHEISVGKEVDGFDLSYNPNEAVIPEYTDLVTDSFSTVAPIFNEAKDVNIHSGNQFFVKMQMSGVATTDYIDQAIAEAKSQILGGAGEDYDTLKEIEKWITEHQDLYEALLAAMGDKATKAELQSAIEDVNQEIDKKFDNPANEGAPGQVLTKTEDGTQWKDRTDELEWLTLVDNQYSTLTKQISIGDQMFALLDKEPIQVDVYGNNLLELLRSKLMEKELETVTFNSGKALTGYESTFKFKTLSFVDDTLLNGALVWTNEGLYIHDGSGFDRFKGVVLTAPDYKEVQFENQTYSIGVASYRMYTSKGYLEIQPDITTPKGKAVATVFEQYRGMYHFMAQSIMGYMCMNWPDICKTVEQKTGQELNLEDNILWFPNYWPDDVTIDTSDLQEDIQIYLSIYPHRDMHLIPLQQVVEDPSPEAFIKVADLSYAEFTAAHTDYFAKCSSMTEASAYGYMAEPWRPNSNGELYTILGIYGRIFMFTVTNPIYKQLVDQYLTTTDPVQILEGFQFNDVERTRDSQYIKIGNGLSVFTKLNLFTVINNQYSSDLITLPKDDVSFTPTFGIVIAKETEQAFFTYVNAEGLKQLPAVFGTSNLQILKISDLACDMFYFFKAILGFGNEELGELSGSIVTMEGLKGFIENQLFGMMEMSTLSAAPSVAKIAPVSGLKNTSLFRLPIKL